jgi:hypothetical protein
MSYPFKEDYTGILNSLNLRRVPDVIDNLDGSVEIIIDPSFMTGTATLYRIQRQQLINGVSSGPVEEKTSSTRVFSFSGLTGGTTHRFMIRAENNSGYGNYFILDKYISKYTNIAGSGSFQLANSSQSKSLLELSNSKENFKSKKWATAYKRFDSIGSAPEEDTDTFYSYGTAMYMDSNFDNPNQSAALGFFIGNGGQKGYYISLETTTLAASANKKELRILKSSGGSLTALKDSQTTIAESLNGVYGGREYLVNVKVRFTRKNGIKTVRIYGSVNGYKFTAVDTDFENEEENIKNVALTPTKQVALICQSGKVAFDYVYATEIKTKDQFDRLQTVGSIQNGIFSNDFLEVGFGDVIYNPNTSEDSSLIPPNGIDEFGTTVREIYTAKLKFDTRPAFPINVSTGINTGATLLGSRMGNFDAEVYLLNNSSTTIPLDGSSLYIYGNTLSDSGQLEYKTNNTSEYVYKEPVIFETKWIQNLEDVESLANWIKQNVVNKGKIVNLDIFGNPAISVGEIITIKYNYAGLSGDSNTERFIITGVIQEYKNGGLTTRLTARKIHFSNV